MLLALGACTQPTAGAPPSPSPDTKPLVAYVAGGKLFVLGAAGTPAPVGPVGQASEPQWSFDAAWLSYSLGGAIHVVRADGTGDHAVAGALAPVAWSPVTETLAFTVRDGRGIGLAPAVGQPSDLVLTGTGLLDSFAWSPDGNRIAYAVAPWAGGGDTLFTVTADGGRYERYLYTPPPDTGILLAGWQPDGLGVLAWLDGGHSASVAADGLPLADITRTSTTATDLVTSRTYAPWVQWSPDHSRLLVVEGPGREPWTAKSLTLCTMPAAACTRLPQPAGTVSMDPAWSPDGGRIAFVRAPAMGSPGAGADFRSWYPTRRLWVANADGTAAHEVPGAGAGVAAPSWSRDAKTLRYSTVSSIAAIPVDGGAPKQLAVGLSGDAPAEWALSGKQPWGGIAVWAPGS